VRKVFNLTEEEKKKLGRPFSEKPKVTSLSIKLDKETQDILNDYTEKEKVSKSEAVRRGIHKLK